MPTPQAGAIQSAQNLVSLCGQALTLYGAINNWSADYTQNNYATYWANFATAATNTDGSVGTTDGSPNTAHIITVPASSPLYVTETQLVNAKTFVLQFLTFMTQAGGTLSMPAQANITSAGVVAPNVL